MRRFIPAADDIRSARCDRRAGQRRADRSHMRHSDRTRTFAMFFALAAGAAWIVDVAVITAIDNSFDPLDSILFLGGLVCLVATGVLVGTLASRRFTGARRVLIAAGVALSLMAGLVLVSVVVDAASHELYHGSNRGLHNECGIFAIGLGALTIAALLRGGSAIGRYGVAPGVTSPLS
jgi:hypothetical protein